MKQPPAPSDEPADRAKNLAAPDVGRPAPCIRCNGTDPGNCGLCGTTVPAPVEKCAHDLFDTMIRAQSCRKCNTLIVTRTFTPPVAECDPPAPVECGTAGNGSTCVVDPIETLDIAPVPCDGSGVVGGNLTQRACPGCQRCSPGAAS